MGNSAFGKPEIEAMEWGYMADEQYKERQLFRELMGYDYSVAEWEGENDSVRLSEVVTR